MSLSQTGELRHLFLIRHTPALSLTVLLRHFLFLVIPTPSLSFSGLTGESRSKKKPYCNLDVRVGART